MRSFDVASLTDNGGSGRQDGLVDYDLTRLGDARFEHLTQALAIAVLGPGVEVFGAGPDGGREASFDGEFEIQTGTRWSGFGVLQSKYKRQIDGPSLDQRWFFAQVRSELEGWVKKESRRRRRPEYLLLATNVRLSGVADTGGIDRLDRLLEEFVGRGLTLKGYQVWHADKIRALLENHYDVRRAYADLVLPGDVIARLHEQLRESDAKIEQAWLGHAGRALLANKTVALGESGDAANTPLALEQVAVDLKARLDGTDEGVQGALAALVNRGDSVLAPKLQPAHKARVVVLGGPGQGKSTIARLLCQLYRVAMLGSCEPSSVVGEVREAAERMRAAFDDAGLPTPTLNRVPVYAQLTAFADEISGGADLSLLRHLTAIVNSRATERLGDSDMKKLLRDWPSLIVLDGLDEVASPAVRVDLIGRIRDFMGEMAALGADVLLVCTSRPQGFEGALPREHYDYLTLLRLDGSSALSYAKRFLDVRHAHDPERREAVAGRLRSASEEPSTARLMETPLQVTIMALLLESLNRPPSNRHGLFDRYYEVIYAREVGKPGSVGALLDRYRAEIDALHARTALSLHRNAEVAGEAESILSMDGFRGAARALLVGEGWTEERARPLAEQLVAAASHRLVLMVPRGDGIAFEVRSLQEFMAAKALTDGSDTDIPARLEVIAASAHWRNTWLLSAGRVFADRRSLRADITSLIDRMDEVSHASMLVVPGACLAVDVIDDGLAATSPTYEGNLLSSAMRLLDGPPCRDIVRLAHAVRPRMEASKQVREAVERQVTRRCTSGGTVPLGTLAFLSTLAGAKAGGTAEWARVQRDRMIPKLTEAHPDDQADIAAVAVHWPERAGVMAAKIDERALVAAAEHEGLSVKRAERGVPVLESLERSVGTFDGRVTDDPRLLRDVAAAYARDLNVAEWRSKEAIRDVLSHAIERDETGELLDQVYPPDAPDPTDGALRGTRL